MGRFRAWLLGLVVGLSASTAHAREGWEAQSPGLLPRPYAGSAASRGFCSPSSLLWLLHAGGGAAWGLSGDGFAAKPAYFIDLTEALRCGINRDGSPDTAGLSLIPEVGYTLQSRGGQLSHFARLGLAVGYGVPWASVHYNPRIVVGSREGDAAFGIRHGVTIYLLLDVFRLDAGHQILFSSGRAENDLRISLHLNMLVVIWLLGSMR